MSLRFLKLALKPDPGRWRARLIDSLPPGATFSRASTKAVIITDGGAPVSHATDIPAFEWDANLGGRALSIDPAGGDAADFLTIAKAIPGSSAQGTVGMTWVPTYAASGRIAQAADDTILRCAGAGEFDLTWTGSAAVEAGVKWTNGASNLILYPRHAANAVHKLMVHWGGGPSRPHLQIDGWARMLPALQVFTPGDIRVACGMADGQNPCRVRDLFVHTRRYNSAQRWIIVGDSISSETYNGGSDPAGTIMWPRTFGNRIWADRGAYLLAEGVSGRRTTDWTAGETDLKVRDQLCTDVIIMLGVNDLTGGGGTDLATFQTDMTALLARLAGYPSVERIYLCTITPIGFSGPIEVSRLAINDWIRTQPTNVYQVIDTTTAIDDGPGNQIDVPYRQDSLHPNTAGSVVLGDFIADEVGLA